MIIVDSIKKSAIQRHYDVSTVFYRLFWGSHIHHGLWSGVESPAQAQLNLIDTLASCANLRPGERILDVGCGMGGSSIHLAKARHCHVTGITLSPVQRLWAALAASWVGVTNQTDFLCQDAERAIFDPQAFDVVWSIEATEHLFDKPTFFRSAANWLRPGGRLAICAWLAKENSLEAKDHAVLQEVCHGMLCPSLGSRLEYAHWIESNGLKLTCFEDWTDRVFRTWEICSHRIQHFRLRGLARWLHRESIDFLDRFQSMLDAYAYGALRYGCFVAEAPLGS